MALRKSLVRFTQDQFAPLGNSLVYFDFDAHGDTTEMPSQDCVGLHQYTYTDNNQFIDVVFGLTFSTFDDDSLLRMISYIDWFAEKMRPIVRCCDKFQRRGSKSAPRQINNRPGRTQPRLSSLKKSLPLSSMTMKAGKFSTSMRQIASIPSSG